MSTVESTYPERLLAVIRAPDHRAKAAALTGVRPPADGAVWSLPELPGRPGRPPGTREAERPPRRRRGLQDPHGRLRFLHALHQIELSAVDLACLLCLRAGGQAAALHADHLLIAHQEAIHAGLLHDHLVAHGHPPGSESVHFRLWDTACAADDIGEQLVVVPRFLEARGLDVTAEMLPRLLPLDPAAHAILQRIYQDEQEHVAIGTRWHRHWCRQQGLDPQAHFEQVCRKHFADQLPGPIPLDRPGRLAAGFWPTELDFLEAPSENG